MKEEKFTAFSHVGRWRGTSIKPPPTPIYRQYLILHCSIHKNLFFLLLSVIQLTIEGQFGKIQKDEPVTCWQGSCETRLCFWTRWVRVHPSWNSRTHLHQDFSGQNLNNQFFVPKITNGDFYFPISSTWKHCSVEKEQTHKCCTRVRSLVIVYGFGWSADHTNCWGVPSPINCV